MRRDDTPFNDGPDFGQGRFATDAEIRPHLGKEGNIVGYYERQMFTYGGQSGAAGWMHLGGAGSSKTASLIVPLVSNLNWRQPRSMLVLDIKGEITKVTWKHQKRLGRKVYVLNPSGMFDLPQDRADPIAELLKKGSPTLHADSAMAVDWLNPATQTHGSRDPFFETAAKRRQFGPLLCLADDLGGASLPKLYRLMRKLSGAQDVFAETTKVMLSSSNAEVRAEVSDLITQRQHGEKTHVSIMETVFNNLRWLGDPLMQEALSQPNFSLAELVSSEEPVIVYLCIPASLIDVWKPYIRTVIGAAMLHAERSIGAPKRRRPFFVLDEAAQLGRAEFMLRAYSFGRSAFDILTAWQSLGQIRGLYGNDGLVELLSSSGLKTIEGGGIHDLETASYFSNYLGETTRAYIDPSKKAAHDHASWSELWGLFSEGGDPVKAMASMMHNRDQAKHPEHHSRKLQTPDELLGLDPRKRLVLRSGLHPFYVDKVPYWDDPHLRGRFDPNPYHG